MLKPAMAAVIGLLCVAAAAAEMGILGNAGRQGDGTPSGAPQSQGRPPVTSEAEDRLLAQVPGSHVAYGWRYPYAFPWDPFLNQYLGSSEPVIQHGLER